MDAILNHFKKIRQLDFKCKSQGGDGKRVNGEPDMRCPENKGAKSEEDGAKPTTPEQIDKAKVIDAVDRSWLMWDRQAPKPLTKIDEVEAAVEYMRTSSKQEQVYVEPDVLKSYLNKIEANLPKSYTKTKDTLMPTGLSGSKEFTDEYYKGAGKEIYKKDRLKNGHLQKDVPFVKRGSEWIEVDSRDISGTGKFGHKDYVKFVFSVDTKKIRGIETGRIFSHQANARLNPESDPYGYR